MNKKSGTYSSVFYFIRKTIFVVAASMVVQMGIGSVLFAGILFYDDFSYTTGNNLSGNSGPGWGGSWSASGTGVSATVEALTLSGPTNYSLATGTVAKLTPGTSSASMNRTFSSGNNIDLSPTTTQTYYFSELFCRVDSSNGTSSETPYYLSLRNSSNTELLALGTGSQEAFSFTASATATGSTASSVSTANNFYTTGTSFAAATSYLIIGKMVLNPSGTTDDYYFSIIPATGIVSLTEPVTWDLHLTVDSSGTVTQLYIGTTVNAETLYIDNLYFASDYLSVISAVPEVPTCTLLFVGTAFVFGCGIYRKKVIAA